MRDSSLNNILNGFKIGNVPVKPALILAPMSGVTEIAFRALIREANPDSIGLTVSEFVSVEGLARSNPKTLALMRRHADEAPFSIQLFGSNPEKMAVGAEIAEESGCNIVDINAGCPAPKIVKKGGGSELLRNLKTLEKILTSVKKAVKIPVTLKIRSGWDTENNVAMETAEMAQDCGIDMICIHPRTRMQGFRGDADWNIIGAVKQVLKIPVVGSGDVWKPEDAFEKYNRFNVDGIMIGRGILCDPWLFGGITDLFSNKTIMEKSLIKKLETMEKYSGYLVKYGFPPKSVLGRLKQLAARMVKGFPGAGKLRLELLRSQSSRDFFMLLKSF
ncbi:MAG: tRNA dihydrouridine synthase DusB [bacterium]